MREEWFELIGGLRPPLLIDHYNVISRPSCALIATRVSVQMMGRRILIIQTSFVWYPSET